MQLQYQQTTMLATKNNINNTRIINTENFTWEASRVIASASSDNMATFSRNVWEACTKVGYHIYFNCHTYYKTTCDLLDLQFLSNISSINLQMHQYCLCCFFFNVYIFKHFLKITLIIKRGTRINNRDQISKPFLADCLKDWMIQLRRKTISVLFFLKHLLTTLHLPSHQSWRSYRQSAWRVPNRPQACVVFEAVFVPVVRVPNRATPIDKTLTPHFEPIFYKQFFCLKKKTKNKSNEKRKNTLWYSNKVR